MGKGDFSLYLSWDIHLRLPLDTDAPGSQASGFGLERHCWISWASDLQVADCGTSQPPQLHQARRKWQPTPVFLPGKSHGQRSLLGYSPCGHKELDTTERLHFQFYTASARERPRVRLVRLGEIFLPTPWWVSPPPSRLRLLLLEPCPPGVSGDQVGAVHRAPQPGPAGAGGLGTARAAPAPTRPETLASDPWVLGCGG